MKRPHRSSLRRSVAVSAAFIALLAGLAAWPPSAVSDSSSLGQLQSQLANQQAREQALGRSVGTLSASVAALRNQIALVQAREAAVRADLARDRRALAVVSASLGRERARLERLRGELAWARHLLAAQLVSSYEGGQPDLVSVVIDANGFSDLLERITFLRDAESAQQKIIDVTRAAKARAAVEAARLGRLQARDRQLAAGAQVRVRAL